MHDILPCTEALILLLVLRGHHDYRQGRSSQHLLKPRRYRVPDGGVLLVFLNDKSKLLRNEVPHPLPIASVAMSNEHSWRQVLNSDLEVAVVAHDAVNFT